MFVAAFGALRGRVTVLPAALADPATVGARLAGMSGVAALEGDRLVGFLTSWFPIPAFRRTTRTGAYVPEWGHASVGPDRRSVDNALYRAAARPTTPLHPTPDFQDRVRTASRADASALAELDAEHVRHYAAPPVLMPPPGAFDERSWRRFIEEPGNVVTLAEDDRGPYGFIRFGQVFGGSAVVESPTGTFISGAFVRDSHRRRGAAAAMLDRAMRGLAAAGVTACAVDFEAFNPDAAAFWPRHFTVVCYSLMRVPELPRGAVAGSDDLLDVPVQQTL
jgi:GNAT superfamily N-acetyltransferase